MSFIVAITDYVFPSLEPERAVLAPLGVELRPQQCRSEEEIIALAHDADAILNCYAKMTARVIEGAQALPDHRALRNWRRQCGFGRSQQGRASWSPMFPITASMKSRIMRSPCFWRWRATSLQPMER